LTNILGISALYHDSAAALVVDGDIVAAAQEERYSRRKHDASFPKAAIGYCLEISGLVATDLDAIVFYEKPLLHLDRLIETHLATAPYGFRAFRAGMHSWLGEKLGIERTIRRRLGAKKVPVLFTEHHEAHMASAFFPSPFTDAAILTVDGVGEWATTMIGSGNGSVINPVSEIRFPHSLGLLYSAFTYYTGFKVNSGEYKVMGLAPYGRPVYVADILTNLIDLKNDGSFLMNMEYFDYCSGLTMTSPAFDELFGGPPRAPESELRQRDMDLAASVQNVVEEAMLRLVDRSHREVGGQNLCMSGGVALNCVANGRIAREGPFENIWVQPAAGDAGSAIGAALSVWHREFGGGRKADGHSDGQSASLLGPSWTNREIEDFLTGIGAPFQYLEDDDLLTTTARHLSDGAIVGWFQGRMEFGPRALGNRSILGDPRRSEMQRDMNLKIKYRESFRPFAPSVLAEKASEYFEIDRESPYMLLVAPVRDDRRQAQRDEVDSSWGIEMLNMVRSDIPAVTHVDYSARVQTVTRSSNPRYHALLEEFHDQTGCAVLVNTSFNVRGEPIVCTPEDAYRCFMHTEIDHLVMENYLISKTDSPPKGKLDSRSQVSSLDSSGGPIGRAECRRTSQSMALVLAAVGLFRWWSAGLASAWPWLVAGCLLVLLGVAVPGVLLLPTRVWRWVFLLLGRIQSTVFFLLVYLLLVTLIGMVRRRRNLLRMTGFKVEESSWVDRRGGLSDPSRLY
jgi:carbamoyltransferase